MPVFFNGREIITPGTFSAVDVSALANTNLTVGNVLAIIGPSSGGAPNTPLVFGDPNTAAQTLISGELLTAVQNAFNPSSQTNSPSEVIAIRVNPATQSTLALKDAGANTVINLASDDYGQYTQQIKVSLATGSVSGLLVTTSLGNAYYTQDNISRTPFSIQYTGGQASATMTITATTLTLFAPGGTQVAQAAFSTYQTFAALVSWINTIPGFAAQTINGSDDLSTQDTLDFTTAVDVKTALYTATANLQAVIDWFNSPASPLVNATRAANAGDAPAPLAATYLTGGSDGVITNTQWQNALTVLQTQNVQWVNVVTSSLAIIAMVDAHVQFMSTTGKKERRAICGMATGTSDADAVTAAQGINSNRTSLVHLGYYGYNAAGVLTLYSPYLLAAMIAGGFAGLSPGETMTNHSLNVRGLERLLQDPVETDPLITGGITCVEQNEKGAFIVTKAISTWLNDDNFYNVEQSTGAAVDYTVRNLRQALDPLRGQVNDPNLLSLAESTAISTLTQLAKPAPDGPGVLVGDENNPTESPPFQNVTASIQQDAVYVSAQISPGIPANYVLISLAAVPFSGSISG